MLFRYRLLQDTEYSSLHYTVDPCWLWILYTAVVCLLIQNSYFPLSLFGNQSFVFSVCESIFP